MCNAGVVYITGDTFLKGVTCNVNLKLIRTFASPAKAGAGSVNLAQTGF